MKTNLSKFIREENKRTFSKERTEACHNIEDVRKRFVKELWKTNNMDDLIEVLIQILNFEFGGYE